MLSFYLWLLKDPEDQLKMKQLYTTYRLMMFSTAKRIVKEEHDAEDVVHDAFLRVIKMLDDIGKVDSPDTCALLMTITRNLAINVLRQRARRWHVVPIRHDYHHYYRYHDYEEGEPEDPVMQIEDKRPSPLDQVQKNALHEAALEAVDQLNPDDREMIYLYYFVGCSVANVAKILEVSPNAVYKRLSKGRAKLKKILKKKGYSVGDIGD